MKKRLYKKKAAYGAVVCILGFIAASCGRVGPCYVETSEEKAAVETANFYYFFDKTLSMKGFTTKGDESQYVQTLPLIWQAAYNAFNSSTERFFEYSTHFTNEFQGRQAIAYVKTESLKSAFYDGDSTRTMGVHVKGNDRQPFSGVADYIRTLNEPGGVYVVVTDLYEQNRENPFFLFFREAFSRGFSGAVFAVESAFSGDIYSVSRINEEKGVWVRDGIATFFICIVGDSNAVYLYSAALAEELKNKAVFNSAVFMTDGVGGLRLEHGDPVMAGNLRRFNSEENALRPVNLRTAEITLINDAPAARTFESYQLLTKTGSRWAAGLPLKNINTSSFSYKVNVNTSYSDGRNFKEGEPTKFAAKPNSTDVSAKIILSAAKPNSTDEIIFPSSSAVPLPVPIAGVNMDCPLYLVIDTKNRAMEKGWYRIDYSIVSEAITEPAWVSSLSCNDIKTLEESASQKGGRVKVLDMADVYKKIADAYNARPRNIYSSELYLIKR
jgi:hypothetical protein